MQLYHEKQYNRMLYLLVFILLLAVSAWVVFAQQIIMGHPVGTDPAPNWAVWLIFGTIGIVFPAYFLFVPMSVAVHADDILVLFPPYRRVIQFEDITDVQLRTFNAIWEYGGWGIRFAFPLWKHNMIAISGNQGVELTLKSGEKLMIGSTRPTELLRVIHQKLGWTLSE